MLDGGTPVTIGLVIIVFTCIAVAVAVVLWFIHKFGEFRTEIVTLIERVQTSVGESLSDAHKAVDALKDRVHGMELDAVKQRATTAETYMTKSSAGMSIDRLTVEITTLRQDVGGRLGSIESHLRNGHAAD